MEPVKTQFSHQGKAWRPIVTSGLIENLPPGCYTVARDPANGFFLESISSFKLPAKIYGTSNNYADRILNTFKDRAKATGVILSGEKGSGKSLLAQSLSVKAATEDIPTIVINAAWCGDQFNLFLQSIVQPTVVLFDEFEKVYPKETQEAVLTLLDGMYPSNKLYVFTINDKFRVDVHMRNRPGRIFYSIDYVGLDLEFVREYCNDRLDNQAEVDSVIKISMLFKDFNFDMLQALVEEMNRYKESALAAVRLLNIKPEFDTMSMFDVEITSGSGDEIESVSNPKWKGNPLTSTVGIGLYLKIPDKEKNLKDANDISHLRYHIATFNPGELAAIHPEEGVFEFKNAGGDILKLKREVPVMHDVFRQM